MPLCLIETRSGTTLYCCGESGLQAHVPISSVCAVCDQSDRNSNRRGSRIWVANGSLDEYVPRSGVY